MYAPWSPYNYVLGNPIINTDPDGRSVNNEYVVDNATGETVQVGTAGGDEVDFVYTGDINEDGSVTIDNTSPEVIEVETELVFGGGDRELSRSPGKRVYGLGMAQGSLQTMDLGDDPIFNLLTMGPFWKAAGKLVGSVDDLAILGAKAGRKGKQARLRELADDDKLGKADRGWLRQEINNILRGKRKRIRNPPGKDLAHDRGRESAKGFSYYWTKLKDRALHRLQHKHDKYGRLNKPRPPKGNKRD